MTEDAPGLCYARHVTITSERDLLCLVEITVVSSAGFVLRKTTGRSTAHSSGPAPTSTLPACRSEWTWLGERGPRLGSRQRGRGKVTPKGTGLLHRQAFPTLTANLMSPQLSGSEAMPRGGSDQQARVSCQSASDLSTTPLLPAAVGKNPGERCPGFHACAGRRGGEEANLR